MSDIKFLLCILSLSLSCSEKSSKIPLRIGTAFTRKKQGKAAFRHRRKHFADSVGITPATKGDRLAGIPTIILKSRKKPYPPPRHDIYETNGAKKVWEGYRKATPYPDRRDGKTWKPLLKLEPGSLQYVVGEDESAIFRDKKTGKIVGMVIRNFSRGNQHLLDSMNGVIEENTGERRSVRVGSTSKLHLGWCSQYFIS